MLVRGKRLRRKRHLIHAAFVKAEEQAVNRGGALAEDYHLPYAAITFTGVLNLFKGLATVIGDVQHQRLGIGSFKPPTRVKAFRIAIAQTNAEEELALIAVDERLPV